MAIATCFSTLRSLPSMLMSPEGGLDIKSSLTSEHIYSNVFFETLKKYLNPSSSSLGIVKPGVDELLWRKLSHQSDSIGLGSIGTKLTLLLFFNFFKSFLNFFDFFFRGAITQKMSNTYNRE
uniref:Uncharacterized protein n=1 Tax=Opuntia streptacantha TaxID=393608 RepID=A0A7C9EUX7_OPUST